MDSLLSDTNSTIQDTFVDSLEIDTDFNSETDTVTCNCDSNDEYNRHLQGRIMHLRETIQTLKKQLHEEREIWKREMAERRENDYINRAAEIGYYYADQNMINTNLASPGLNMGMGSGLDAEIITKYSDNLVQCHYENRQNLQKQIAMANYKRRLLEVENMCNLELLRVKQSVQILQPLQAMCSEWRFPDEGGDFKKAESVTDVTDEEKLKNLPTEVIMPPECINQHDNLLMSETIPLEMCRSQQSLID